MSSSPLRAFRGGVSAPAAIGHAGAVGAAVVALLIGAGSTGCTSAVDRASRALPEQFGSTTTHSRNYAAGGTATCEAARRALLSQGYVITLADADHVNGKKNFQPQPENHVEVEFHVVCAPEDRQGRKSIVFVNALQDRYALKKSNNSASLGVGVLGSVSLPFSSSDDALVKVASETITTEVFYERFFTLVDRYLSADTADDVPMTAQLTPPAALASAGGASSAPGAAAPAPASASAPAPAAPAPPTSAAGASAAAASAPAAAMPMAAAASGVPAQAPPPPPPPPRAP